MGNYIRDGRGSLLIAGTELIEESSYQMEMLKKSHPAGLLPVQICAINEQREYHYDAGCLLPISEYLEKRTISSKMLGQYIDSVKCVLSSVEEYLLEADCLCMEPEHIYTEETEYRLQFCYAPCGQGGFEKGLLKLLQFFLEKLNYDDQQGVTMAYQVYQNVVKEGYSSVFTYKIVDEQPVRQEVVFPWEEKDDLGEDREYDDTERSRTRKSRISEGKNKESRIPDNKSIESRYIENRNQGNRNQKNKNQASKNQGSKKQGNKYRENRNKESRIIENKNSKIPPHMICIGIYIAGILVCGIAAGVCYFQRNLLLSGIVLFWAVAAILLLIHFGRQYKGIDRSQNTW